MCICFFLYVVLLFGCEYSYIKYNNHSPIQNSSYEGEPTFKIHKDKDNLGSFTGIIQLPLDHEASNWFLLISDAYFKIFDSKGELNLTDNNDKICLLGLERYKADSKDKSIYEINFRYIVPDEYILFPKDLKFSVSLCFFNQNNVEAEYKAEVDIILSKELENKRLNELPTNLNELDTKFKESFKDFKYNELKIFNLLEENIKQNLKADGIKLESLKPYDVKAAAKIINLLNSIVGIDKQITDDVYSDDEFAEDFKYFLTVYLIYIPLINIGFTKQEINNVYSHKPIRNFSEKDLGYFLQGTVLPTIISSDNGLPYDAEYEFEKEDTTALPIKLFKRFDDKILKYIVKIIR